MLVEKINIYSANKPYNPNFNSRFIDYGTPAVLPEHLLNKLALIRKNYMNIRDFFEPFKNKNFPLSSRIKKGFTDLIPKKQEALTFKYDGKNAITIMCSRKKPQFMWISTNDRPFDGIVIDDNKLVANYLKNNPHMLPHKIQYMNEERLQAAEPEKLIELAHLKIEQYKRYLDKFRNGEIPYPPQNGNIQTDISPKFIPIIQRAEREALTGIKEPEPKPETKIPPEYYGEYWKIFTNEFNRQINVKLQNFYDTIK